MELNASPNVRYRRAPIVLITVEPEKTEMMERSQCSPKWNPDGTTGISETTGSE